MQRINHHESTFAIFALDNHRIMLCLLHEPQKCFFDSSSAPEGIHILSVTSYVNSKCILFFL